MLHAWPRRRLPQCLLGCGSTSSADVDGAKRASNNNCSFETGPPSSPAAEEMPPERGARTHPGRVKHGQSSPTRGKLGMRPSRGDKPTCRCERTAAVVVNHGLRDSTVPSVAPNNKLAASSICLHRALGWVGIGHQLILLAPATLLGETKSLKPAC